MGRCVATLRGAFFVRLSMGRTFYILNLWGENMALMKCPECGKEISDKATSCPSCGCPISQVNQTVTENSTSSSNAMDYCVDNQVSMPNNAQEDGNVCVNSCEQSSQMPKLKMSHKIFISIGAVVAAV